LSNQEDLRDRFLATINHTRDISLKVTNHTVARGERIFVSPDQYKIFEGLFLTGWTYWEQFIRQLLIADLANLPSSILRNKVSNFRTTKANEKLAELLLDHPDAPDRWIEWSSISTIRKRADNYLGTTNRFSVLAPVQSDFKKLKIIRNAVAHKSDKAWIDFKDLITNTPFSLTPNQRKGVTVGRFLANHHWDTTIVIDKIFTIFETTSRNLVP